MEKKKLKDLRKSELKDYQNALKKKRKKSFDNYFKSRYVNVKKRGNQFKA